nr:retrovirus-related Pol polyprotein from transposon TNT 1-94 [Tanacetum cinerariifolium]
MAQENYVEGCSMQRPPLLEPNGFYFWKAHFETYVKSKDINLWQVIQNGDFYFEVEDEEIKLMKEMSYELLKDEQKKQVGKNNKAKMTLYNSLPCKEYERVFMCKTAKESLISNKETIYSGFTRFNAIVTSLKYLDSDYSSKNHIRKFLRALPLKWRAKVIAIAKAKDLATLPLEELIGNLKFYEMVLDNDGVTLKTTTKEKIKSIALKAKVTGENTSDDSDSQDESDEDLDEEEAEAFNFLARNFRKFFRNECHFASECRKSKENKAFLGGSWSDSEDSDEHQNDATCIMAIDSHEACLKCDLLPDDWIMDSGCTKHMTGNRRLFTSYKAYNGGHVVFGSNLKGKVVSGGNITHDSITITNVEHVSGLAFNLINVGKLCNDDCAVSFTKVDCDISKNRRFLAKGHRRNYVYTYKLGDNSKQQICLASIVDSSTLWHRRLDHANIRLVQNLASNEQLRKLPKLSFERHFCDTCGLGSQSNTNNRIRKEVSTTRVLELLHKDLVGSSPIQSYRGNFYNLIIVDDHSNYTWVVFVESKEDALEKFKILCKKLENLHDCSIISIIINHCREFDKLQFGSFYEQHGMSYNLSGLLTSQSNKIVERTHRKLRKISRAMLAEQSIPQKFWFRALDTETYIFNRVYIRKFINKTPYKILRNRKPSLEYFKVFGCKVFILNTKVYLTKFDPNSYEGVFLGYSQISKAYIVLNKETMRIEESLNVTFDESLPKPKSSSSVEDDRIDEPIVQDLNGSPSLQVNVSDEGYPKSLKEAIGHPIEQVIGELNERTLKSKTKQA